ncbi:MAG: hypothetical protein BM562_06850 [Alphaproteobacteria bacterium MedPE-SWcel]|nr:MAG: hypothetical protein BM562_06850 [Alphaproteobacteria bacterium MedPE-SWcel]
MGGPPLVTARWAARLLSVGALLSLAVSSGQAQEAEEGPDSDPSRVAIVVGVGDYKTGPNRNILTLQTPPNDARAYADALHRAGWSFASDRVSYLTNRAVIDPTAREIFGAIEDAQEAFGTEVRSGTVLFVFNGHGFTDNNRPRILPAPSSQDVDYSIGSSLRSEGIEIDDIVSEIERQLRPWRIILIINACGNPLDASWLAPQGTVTSINHQSDTELLVFYSSTPGSIAYDLLQNELTAVRNGITDINATPGLMSVFSRHLVPRLNDDLPLLEILTRTRIDVERFTAKARRDRLLTTYRSEAPLQIPFVLHDQIDGTFSLTSTSDTGSDAPGEASDWRDDPKRCRRDKLALAAALDERPSAMTALPMEVRECIFEASLEALGLTAINQEETGQVNVITPTGSSKFQSRDALILRINVYNPATGLNREPLNSSDDLERLLVSNAFIDGAELDFVVERGGDTKVVYCAFSTDGASCED